MAPSFTVMRSLQFCYGHRLLNYDGPCRYLHGHNARVDIWLAADRLNAQGMVYDFREIKRIATGWIDQHIDHRMILQKSDPIVPLLQAQGEPVYVIDTPPTAENLAHLLGQTLRQLGLPVQKLQLWEQEQSCAIIEWASA